MKKFYGFEYESGMSTTTGTPNKTTGGYSIAGKLYVFSSAVDRDIWIEVGESSTVMRGNPRVAVTLKEARRLHLGMSMDEYNLMLSRMDDEYDYERDYGYEGDYGYDYEYDY